MPRPTFPVLRLTLSLILMMGLVACQARIQEAGSIIKPEDINKIVVGVTDFREVRRLLGPPTLINTFQRQRWIYVQDRRYKNIQRTFARAANRIEITFDRQGIVQDLERNFGETLMDPEKDPNTELKSDWGSWLWKGQYDQPATGMEPTPDDASSSTENPAETEGEGKPAAVDTEAFKEPTQDATQPTEPIEGTVESTNQEASSSPTTMPPAQPDQGKEKENGEDPAKPEKAWWRFW